MKCFISCVQTNPIMYGKEKNVQKMCDFIDEVMANYPKTQLIVFPELATTGYECGDKFQELAEVPGDESAYSITRISEKAKEFGVFIIYGFAERKEKSDTEIYNSQILIDLQGEIVGTYQKVHLFDTEKRWFEAGNEFKVFKTAIGNIGMFICYDAFFPEAARCMSIMGADLLVNSTNWEKPYDYDMDMLMIARALENTIHLVCCNRVGTDQTLSFFGHSRILDPLGHVIAGKTLEAEGIIHAQVDFAVQNQMRKNYYTMLSERRPDTYKEISKA